MEGHITASGNISASLNIQAQKFISNGKTVISYESNLDATVVNSSAPNLFLAGNITASSLGQGNISASGDIFAQNITAAGIVTAHEFHTQVVSASIIFHSGSTKFGDTTDDTHIFTGSVDITGDLKSGKLFIDNKAALDTYVGLGNELTLNPDANWDSIRLNRDGAPKAIILNGPVTASGKISASGDIIGKEGSFASEIAIRNGNGSGLLFSQTPDKLYYDNTDIIISLDDSDQYKFGLGGLTSSKAISASGHLAVNEIQSPGFALITPVDKASTNAPVFKTTGEIDNQTAIISLGDPDGGDTGAHIRIEPGTSTVRLNDLRLITTGSIENKSGTPVVTHTASPISSSFDHAGKYHVVGGNLTCSIQNDSTVAQSIIGAEWTFFQSSSVGNFLFESASNLTVISKNGSMRLAEQGSSAVLKKVASLTYHLIGDLT
jgi:cytoskeletal protein CcmA (bactofilin family)